MKNKRHPKLHVFIQLYSSIQPSSEEGGVNGREGGAFKKHTYL